MLISSLQFSQNSYPTVHRVVLDRCSADFNGSHQLLGRAPFLCLFSYPFSCPFMCPFLCPFMRQISCPFLYLVSCRRLRSASKHTQGQWMCLASRGRPRQAVL